MQHESIGQPSGESVTLTLVPADNHPPTLTDWLDACASGATPVAVMLSTSDDHRVLQQALSQLRVVAIDFPDATDGRGFTQARALRQWGYRGELRASGSFERDQLQFLRRCGFDSFDLPDKMDPRGAISSLNDVSIRYQTAYDEERPIHFRMR